MRKKNGTKISVPSITKNLKSIIGEQQAETIARDTGFMRRKRVLDPCGLILAMVSALGVGKANWLADILRAFNALTGETLQYKPFHNQISKWQFPEFMRRVTQAALEKLTLNVLQPVPNSKLAMFKGILMHDGSTVALKDALKNSYPGRFKKSAPAAVELHVTMNLLDGAPWSVTLAPDKESETHFRPEPDMLEGCLCLEDRAYQDRKYFLEVDEANGFFIVRGTKNIRPIIVEAHDVEGNRIRYLEGKKLSFGILPQQSVDLTISWNNGKTKYSGRLVVIYKRGRRNKADYTYLHTNLSRELFSISEVGTLYRLRWQIELLFLEWKSHANLHKFDTTKPAIVEGMIWASIFVAILKRYITHAAELITKTELSTRRAAKSTRHYLGAIVDALYSLSDRRIIRALNKAFDFLSTNAMRAHPDRDRKKGRLKAGLRPIALA